MKRGIINDFKQPEDVVYNLNLRLYLGVKSKDAYEMFNKERCEFQAKHPEVSDFYFLYPEQTFIEKYLKDYESHR